MSELEFALEDCLNRLADGEATLEECLARYPQHAVQLHRLLATASRLEAGRAIHPAPAFRTRTRAQLMTHMRTHPRRRGWVWANPFSQRLGFAFSSTLRVATSLTVIAAFFFATGTVLAQRALPGAALYAWKTTSEQVWRAVQPDPVTADLTLVNRRMQELLIVAGQGQAETLARREYEQALADLSSYRTPEAQRLIEQSLLVQRDTLAQARLSIPEVDQLLGAINPALVKRPQADLQLNYQAAKSEGEQITYNLTISNLGPASPISANSVIDLAPSEKLVSVSDAACDTSAEGSVTCPISDLARDQAYQVTITTAVDRCYAGTLINTATVMPADRVINTNAQPSAVATTSLSAPFPGPAQIIFVQSQARSHYLSLMTGPNSLLNDTLHLRAAAPAWSPDGSKIAFFGEEGISELGAPYSQGNGLWLVELKNNEATQPVQLVAQDHIANIAWSPDGSKLAFEVAPPGLPSEVQVVKADTGEPVSRFPGQQPAWGLDNKHLFIKACMAGCGVWRVNLNGREGEQITFNGTDSYPALASNGQTLAFSSQRDGNWEIYTLRLSDGELARLTNRRATDTTPVFDACGQTIYFRTDRFGDWRLMRMKVDGSVEQTVRKDVGPSDDWGRAKPAIR
ncbi:MAG: hypothetical protein U0401_15790 [Anaerolineae bacterium]